MGHIMRKLPIRGDKGTKELNVLFDSGASRSVINEEVAESICHITPLEEPISLKLANGETIAVTGGCFFSTTLNDKATKQKCSLTGSALVSPDFKGTDGEELIIGVPELQSHQIGLQFAPEGKDRIDLSRCIRRVDRL